MPPRALLLSLKLGYANPESIRPYCLSSVSQLKHEKNIPGEGQRFFATGKIVDGSEGHDGTFVQAQQPRISFV